MSLANTVFTQPAWQTSVSNHITLARLVLGAPTTMLVILLGYPLAGFSIYVAWALTDILDGALARHIEHRTTTWGAHYDPMADKSLCDGMLLFLCATDFSAAVVLPSILVLAYDGAMLMIRAQRPGMPASRLAKLKSFALFCAIGSILGMNAGLAPEHWWPYATLWLATALCMFSLAKYLRP